MIFIRLNTKFYFLNCTELLLFFFFFAELNAFENTAIGNTFDEVICYFNTRNSTFFVIAFEPFEPIIIISINTISIMILCQGYKTGKLNVLLTQRVSDHAFQQQSAFFIKIYALFSNNLLLLFFCF